jgi:AraC-like DNA-binding protein
MSRAAVTEQAGHYRWKILPEDPIMSRVSIHVYCAYLGTFGKEWVRGFVRNHYDRLYYVESGTAVICTPEAEFRLRSGCCYLIPGGQLHRHSCDGKIVLHWCHFQAMLDGISDLFQELHVPLEARPRNPGRYRRTFAALAATMNCRQPRCHLQRAALLLQLIQPHLDLAGAVPRAAIEARERFHPVLRYIDEHLAGDIRIDELAALSALNKEYFSRAFSRHFHMPPKKYILRKRIRAAQRLLCSSDLQVQEAGIRCGFPDPYHFSKTFKHIAGISPAEYRRMYRQRTPPDTEAPATHFRHARKASANTR